MRTEMHIRKPAKVIPMHHRWAQEDVTVEAEIDLKTRREDFLREEAVSILKNMLESFRLPKPKA
ncbi:MAG: hypothetical protein KF799_15820 [Bdellovibrionales bacterium]|nr:hypothetical protein [Bdellovibrionales bacterium]